MWIFGRKGSSGFSYSSTAEEVTRGIHGNGLTAVVTGASSGIGAETTRVLAMRGVHVVMAVRNMEAGRRVEEEILKEIPTAKLDVMELDLSYMDSVRKFESEYNSSERPLNLLINNAGIMATPFKLSKDNIELQFATNHLGYKLSEYNQGLFVSMTPPFRAFSLDKSFAGHHEKDCSGEQYRRENHIIVSSGAHKWANRKGILFDKINDESRYSSLVAYGQSKLANILHTKELTRRFKEEGVNITTNSLHPRGIVTHLLRHHSFMAGKFPEFYLAGIIKTVGKLVLKNVQQGAATTCYVALHPQVKGISGEYFMDSNFANPSYQAKDQELARKLWDFSLSLTDPKQTRESSS